MSIEYEIEMQRLKVMQEQKNRKERILMEKQIKTIESELKQMKYKYFQDSAMSAKIKVVEDNLQIMKRFLTEIKSQDN
tara:strand:+ start:392 stop:625 length:234 start_codon:yes stop_codon:yes gene_type:complete